jgi:two-component system phosphate regulon sensor histidine kinase PhoR
MKDIVDKVFDIFEPRIKKQEVELVSEIPEDLSTFKCNSDRIKQLLINLVDNAINYTEEGHVKVSCREDNDYMIIEVEDTGPGIDKKNLPRLFERFYRVDKGRARKNGGTGLGLSIVKHIAELYNGTVSVKSEVDKGTKFTVKLVKER